MKRLFKRIGLTLAGLLGLFMVALLGMYLHVEAKRKAQIQVDVASFEIPSDPASIAEGRRLVQVKTCSDCHGSDMGGKTFINEAPIGVFSGPNLTPGKGSVVANYTTQDWIRAIRFGIGQSGRPLIFMPAGDFHGMSNEDLGKVIAYLKTLAPVDRESLPQSIGPVSRVLYHLNQMPFIFPYENVPLKDESLATVTAAPTAEYGKYLSMACVGCHGSGFAGGHIPGTPPVWPDAKNLTPSGRFASWSLADFRKVLAEGLTPDGHQIDPQFMPWKSMQAMNDVEVEALYKFLKELPAKAEGTR